MKEGLNLLGGGPPISHACSSQAPDGGPANPNGKAACAYGSGNTGKVRRALLRVESSHMASQRV